jgi:hypothetical protein
MTPLSTLLCCLPAALILIACAGGVAFLWRPATPAAQHPPGGRRRGSRRPA